MQDKKLKEERFCEKCGNKMLTYPNNMMNFVKDPSIYPKYDKETGKEINYSGLEYICPKKKWYNEHDNYFIWKPINN